MLACMRASIAGFALFVAACATTPGPCGTAAYPGQVELSAAVESKRVIQLTLTDRTLQGVSYDRCASLYRDGDDAGWVPLDRVCTRESHHLNPGEQDRFPFHIPRDLDPDDYVAVIFVQYDGASNPHVAASNVFELR